MSAQLDLLLKLPSPGAKAKTTSLEKDNRSDEDQAEVFSRFELTSKIITHTDK